MHQGAHLGEGESKAFGSASQPLGETLGGIGGVFKAWVTPEFSSRTCRSVKVPPISTAMRTGPEMGMTM
jgi:hypothetical protein